MPPGPPADFFLINGLIAVFVNLIVFGGIVLIVRMVLRNKLEHRKLDLQYGQGGGQRPSDAVLAELRTLQQQMEQMQNTSHGFALSLDEALSRLEGRVSRLETKTAALTAPPDTTTLPLKVGNSE